MYMLRRMMMSPLTIADQKPDINPDTEFEKPWRQITWSPEEKNKLLEDLLHYKISEKSKHLRFLLHGPVGAGKSTFINSVHTALRGRISSIALGNSTLVEGSSGDTFTTKYKTHNFKSKDGAYFPFVISDIMGVEEDESKGVHSEDILRTLQGHVKENYKFNPYTPINEQDKQYNAKATVDDKVHCLVFVLPGDTMSFISDSVMNKLRDVRKKARDLDIPQVVIMTKADDACKLVKTDVKKVYSSKQIKEKMTQCHRKLGVPMNCIFPVKNYSEETDTSSEMDILILKALAMIVNFANDYVEDQNEENDS